MDATKIDNGPLAPFWLYPSAILLCVGLMALAWELGLNHWPW